MISSPVGSQCLRLQHPPMISKRVMTFINLIQTRRTFSSIDRGFRHITPTRTKEGTSSRKQLSACVLLLMASGSLICVFETPVVFRMVLTFRIMQSTVADP